MYEECRCAQSADYIYLCSFIGVKLCNIKWMSCIYIYVKYIILECIIQCILLFPICARHCVFVISAVRAGAHAERCHQRVTKSRLCPREFMSQFLLSASTRFATVIVMVVLIKH